MAATEFLMEYLRFDQRDLSDTDITDTKMSGKKDDILYVVFGSPTKVRDVRILIGDCGNPDIRTRDHIPPMLCDRYATLSKYAADLRSDNKELKTQIRFIKTDIALFTKKKGTDDPFLQMDMGHIESEINLRGIYYSVTWKKKTERLPWRRTSPDNRKISLKSLGGGNSGREEPRRSYSPEQPLQKKSKYTSPGSSPSGSESGKDGSPARGKDKNEKDMDTSL